MSRVNIDILGISEIKWTGMGKFNSDEHYIYYCGQESIRRNGVSLIVNKRAQNAVFGCNFKNNRMFISFCSFPRQAIQYHSNTSLCPKHKEAEVEWFYEDLQDLLELTPKKDVLFIIENWNAKVESQETPGVTGKFGLGIQNEAGQRVTRVLPKERTGHSKYLLQQHKRRLYTWTSPDSQHQNQIDYILCSQRWKHYFANKGPSSQGYGFSSSHVWM